MKQRQKLRPDAFYTRLSTKDSSDEEDTELFTRKSNFKEIPTVEINLDEADTLQALSIRYRCSIEELKRLNNIHKDNEIYALRSVKVPSRPFTAALAGIHPSGKNSPEKPVLETALSAVNNEVLSKKLNNTLLNLCDTSDAIERDFNQVIFNSNLVSSNCPSPGNLVSNSPSHGNIDGSDCRSHGKPSERGNEFVDSENLDEDVRLLPQEVVLAEPVVSKYSCNGADADLSWITLIVCIIIVIFVVPLIYVLYIAEHPEEYHHEPHMHQVQNS